MKNGKNRLKIAIVNSSSFGIANPNHLKKLQALGDVERIDVPKDIDGKSLAEKLQGVSIIAASVLPNYDKAFFEHQKGLFLITRHGIGLNNIDIEEATKHNVLITRVQGILEQESMAEHTITLILTVTRKLVPSYIAVKEGKWKERVRFIGTEIRNKKIGILGLGNIGSRVCQILKQGFFADVITYDPNITKEEAAKKGAKLVSFGELIETSDIITLHAPLTDETYHMLGDSEFSHMKEGIIIIDTARGELIDTNALIKYLKTGKISGVGMDVVEGEPIDSNHPLLGFENVVIGPHIGAYTKECLFAMGDKVVEDIERIVTGKSPDMMVNPEVFENIKEKPYEFDIGS